VAVAERVAVEECPRDVVTRSEAVGAFSLAKFEALDEMGAGSSALGHTTCIPKQNEGRPEINSSIGGKVAQIEQV